MNAKLTLIALLVVSMLLLAGCASGTPTAVTTGKLKVLATTSIVGDVANLVGAGNIDLTVLMPVGADPLPDNYRTWNIAVDGLVITFDAYQVAAYAAGPQIVTIPYMELQAIIDPSGPLEVYLQ